MNATIFRKNSVVSNDRFQYASWYDFTGCVVIAQRPLGSAEWEVKSTPVKGNVLDAHNIMTPKCEDDVKRCICLSKTWNRKKTPKMWNKWILKGQK